MPGRRRKATEVERVVNGQLERNCTRCGEWKPPEAFYLANGGAYRQSGCIECWGARARAKWQQRKLVAAA